MKNAWIDDNAGGHCIAAGERFLRARLLAERILPTASPDCAPLGLLLKSGATASGVFPQNHAPPLPALQTIYRSVTQMSSSTSALKAFVAVAVKAARLAAREITRAANDRDSLQIEDKAVNDFVTSADKNAEAVIVEELKRAFPHHDILTEEAGRIGSGRSDYLWIIDPIDGTTNFIHGVPQYAVSIALTYRDEIIAGVIYDVAKNELFTAAKGQGAFLDNRRIRVSDTMEMNRALIGTGFPFRRGDDFGGYLEKFRRVAELAAGLRRPGSAALDLAWVACGRYDGFWEHNLKPWDMAAGILLVLEAGGLITDLKGGTDWFKGSICCGTPKIFGQLLPLVGELEKPKTDGEQSEKTEKPEKADAAEKKPRRTLKAKTAVKTDKA